MLAIVETTTAPVAIAGFELNSVDRTITITAVGVADCTRRTFLVIPSKPISSNNP